MNAPVGLCSKCKERTYTRTAKSKNTWCHPCRSAVQRSWRDKHPEYTSEQYRRRIASDPLFFKKQDAAKDPIKKKARAALRNAVVSGTVIKPKSCSRCGITDKPLHGHHFDYSKPLEVLWLCKKCHGLEHSKYVIQPSRGEQG